MSSERDSHDDSKLTPSEPSAHGYEPGEEKLSEDSQTKDAAAGHDDGPPVEAQPA